MSASVAAETNGLVRSSATSGTRRRSHAAGHAKRHGCERRRAPEIAGEAHDLHRLGARVQLDRAREQSLHRPAVLRIDAPRPPREPGRDQTLAVELIERSGFSCFAQELPRTREASCPRWARLRYLRREQEATDGFRDARGLRVAFDLERHAHYDVYAVA